MHALEKKMVENGIIDSAIINFHIDEWYENVTIIYDGGDETGNVTCNFFNCYEISLKHDRTYSKEKKSDGSPSYTYFVQSIEIIEKDQLYIVNISAWPFDGQIVCKDISIDFI